MATNHTNIPFRKMNGLGNEFVVLDAREHAIELTEQQICAISDHENGVGCDQLIIIEP